MRTLLITAICISLVFYAGMSYSKTDELCCVWVNAKYESGNKPQKLIFNYDGMYATYGAKNSTGALQQGMFQIVWKWQDSEGNIWYRIKMQDPKYGTKYKLARISKNGDKLEFTCKSEKYPTEINVNNPDYCLYLKFAEANITY
jgi:hypothetical protein